MNEDFEFSPFGIILNFSKQPPFPPAQLGQSMENFAYGIPQGQITIDININLDSDPSLGLINDDGVALLYWSGEGYLVAVFNQVTENIIEDTVTDLRRGVMDELNITSKYLINTQVQTEFRYWVGEDTFEHFNELYGDLDFDDHLPDDCNPAGLRLLSEKEGIADSEAGFDIRLEPHIQNSNYIYGKIKWIEPNLTELGEFISQFEGKVEGMLHGLEDME